MSLTIYHKDSTPFSQIKEYTFTSEHMGDSKISGVIYSPDTIPFAVGDYVIFNSNKYYIPLPPIATKTARSGENIGDALKYDLEFYWEARILQDILFQDYVTIDDTNVYYTGTSTFYFFNNVSELAARIQANLDRFVGAEVWNVSVSDQVDLTDEQQVTVDKIYLWDGLLLANSVYGLDFYISGTTITIGGTGENLSTEFQYSKNNGLYEITRTFEPEEKVITRLKTYGSGRNLPPDYLRDEDAKGRYFTQLMLPNFATTGMDYVDAPPLNARLDVGEEIWAYDSDGDGNLDWNNDTGSALAATVALDRIRAVRIWILARTRNPLRGYSGPKNYIVGDKVINVSDGFQYRLLTTTVHCRNMGL